jgi:hypothetical protein
MHDLHNKCCFIVIIVGFTYMVIDLSEIICIIFVSCFDVEAIPLLVLCIIRKLCDVNKAMNLDGIIVYKTRNKK